MKKILLLTILGILALAAGAAPMINSFAPASGPVGTLIKIQGTGLDNGPTVSVGGVNAITVSVSATEVVVMVMPGTTTAAVVVNTADGNATSATSFTVVPTPVPNIQQGGKLMGPGGTPHMGQSVAISADGNTAIVGGPAGNSNQGMAWIFTRSGGGWSKAATLTGSGGIGASQQGNAVAISADGNTVLIGGNMDDSQQGAVWVFTRSGNTWTQEGNKLVGTGNTGAAQQGFDVALSADGNTALVGGYMDNNQQGAMWVFTRSAGIWSQQGSKLAVFTGFPGTGEGYSVALSADGNTALMGSNGLWAWIFTRSGNSWTQQGSRFTPSDATSTNQFGQCTAISADGNTAVIGGPGDNGSIGAVWVFTRSGSTWSQQGNKLVGTGNVGKARQGSSVGVSADGNTLIEGGSSDNSLIGAIWTFSRTGSSWTQSGNKLVGANPIKPSRLGTSVDLSADGTTAITGGPADLMSNGSAWVYIYQSANADLSALTLSTGTLSFNSATTNYQVTVDNSVTSITVTPTKAEPNATIAVQINGGSFSTVVSGTATPDLPLNTGDNTINVKVTAQNGTTIKTYTITVTRAMIAQVIQFSLPSTNHYYGDDPIPLSATGGGSGNPVTFSSLDNSIAQIQGNTIIILKAGNTSIVASQAGNSSYSAASDVVQPLVIYPKNITVTPDAQNKTYGDPDPVLTYTYTPNLIGSDQFTGRLNRTPGENAGNYAINKNTLALSSNYAITYTPATLTISKKTVMVTADTKSKTYGDADPVLTYTCIPALKSGDAFSGVLSRDAGENIGDYAIQKGSLSISNNYIVNYSGANFSINKKPIDVYATALNKTYGDADPVLAYTYSPVLITGDAFTGSLTRTAGENTGSYPINQNTLVLNNNYTLNYHNASLVIDPKTITVTADAQSKTYGDSDPTLTYSFTPALINGDVFTGGLSRAAGQDVGSYAIGQGTLNLNSNYLLAFNGAALVIGKKTINVTADAKSKHYGDTDPLLTYTYTPALQNSDVFTGSLTRTTGEDVGNYSINQNTLALSNNYTINYTNANLSIGKKSVTLTAEAKNKTYGDADPLLTYTYTPALVNGDSFSGALSRDPGEGTGTYAITQHTLTLSNNYALTYTGADFTIDKKTITVKADAKNKIYGDTDPALTYTYTPGLVNSDAFSGSLSRITGEDAGTYAINQASLVLSNNYVLNYTGADLIINKKTIAVTADARNKTYGDTDPALTYTYTPALVNGDAFTGSLSRNPGENIGTYVINKASLALSNNYVLNYTGANLIINKKTITVTANAQNKNYGDTDPALTYTCTPALINGDAFTGSLRRIVGENVGTYAIGQNDLSLNSNYDLQYTPANLVIKQRLLTITADNQSRIFGDPNPPLHASYSGFVGRDDETVLTTPVQLNTTATVSSPAGNYPITASGATAKNYDIRFTDGILSIGLAGQSIHFTALPTKLSTDPVFTLTATASSGLPILYTSSNTAIAAIINNNQVQILGAGTVTITASQPGNNNYMAATPVSHPLEIANNTAPVLSIRSDKGNSISKGETAVLTATGAFTYEWADANGIIDGQHTAILTVRPSATTTYTVTGANQYGLTATQTFTLVATDNLNEITATNIVTPNGDGINDYWIVKNIDLYPDNEVQIFDRFGKIIYEKKHYDNSWNAKVNGKPLAVDTYYYVIRFGNGMGIKKGFISVVY
ncbi:MBG domain-containing protein [Chitinophaga flava]|uniref:Cadherin-like beta sandwich domain-containing protein n=1 Tax=Chitinophaga flava TaxID=2259036 RepID=A0A365XPS9_9BACT|nr:MBG domain-containing protein [Chitinophaga flava]RBL88352.1 hypothetical protein DF182_17305 [Chitinophaga flava]